MTSRKRWERIYTLENPFRLPQSLIRTLKKCARNFGNNHKPETVRYLWLHFSDDGFVPPQALNDDTHRKLDVDDWLNIIDESASLGAQTLIVSVSCPLSEKPEIWTVCRWAQSVHGMIVGLYTCGLDLSEEDQNRLAELEREKTRLFVDSEHLDRMRPIESRCGVSLCIADGLRPGEASPPCQLPETMTCVRSNGQLYTCGLVLGNERYHLGDVIRERLDRLMRDDSLPHHIPGGILDAPRRCNACPPLMERRMRGLSGHGH